jgi:hypothetical protein
MIILNKASVANFNGESDRVPFTLQQALADCMSLSVFFFFISRN